LSLAILLALLFFICQVKQNIGFTGDQPNKDKFEG